MGPSTSPRRTLSSSQIAVAAEAFAAAQFALCGFDILEQAGRSRFFFDLAVAQAGGMMKLSIHASFNGFWDLVDRFLSAQQRSNASAAEYHFAIDRWLEHHSSRVVCCLVEFDSANLQRMPRLYLATPEEVAARMQEKIQQLAHNELGYIGFDVVHRMDGLPAAWRFSPQRIAELMGLPVEQMESAPQVVEASEPSHGAALPPALTECISLMN